MYFQAMAHDAIRGRVVLFGNGATWEWDGTNWSQRFPATSPPARSSHAMAWDPARGRVVLHGGNGGGVPLSDWWEWDGINWTPRPLVSNAPARFGHGFAWESSRGRALAFGGANPSSSCTADTWEVLVPCDVAGPGHPGGGLPISCLGTPRVGAPLCVTFSNPPPRGVGGHLLLAAGGPPLRAPIALGPPALCAPGFLHLAPQLVVLGTGEPVTFCLPVPALPALAGQGITLQGASLETGGCLRATDALVVTLQP
jgi:hypothetical protein